ncbi:MAG: ATP-binding cassette domain-containing protein [Erysipelotrichia bacterium]|nr:ATP-binding cassette domain-containing protein [Erysipelotrichia bacterium]
MAEKKVLLSVKDLDVKFHVRGRVLSAIRGISLDIYENESIAIVGESGSGKSVFTKTFAGMLDSNGFITNGKIMYNDESLSYTETAKNDKSAKFIAAVQIKLNEFCKYTKGAEIYKQIEELKQEKEQRKYLTSEEEAENEKQMKNLNHQLVEAQNKKITLNKKEDKEEITNLNKEIKQFEIAIKKLEKDITLQKKKRKKEAIGDQQYNEQFNKRLAELNAQYEQAISQEVDEKEMIKNELIAKDIYLSTARFNPYKRSKSVQKLLSYFKKAYQLAEDLTDEDVLNDIFQKVSIRVKYRSEDENKYIGDAILDLAHMEHENDWCQIRGSKIATVFQDPMTSLNPVLTIGQQISSVIIKHQKVSESEARIRALQLMAKVGIPNPENRYDDYPFQYSGGMRQRIVIAIALSCQPKILICDEPTTALDVTIQAQILKLIKDLQQEFGYTIVFITHDLGVVANIADRVAVLYAGQIVEIGTCEEIFYDPKHPYTWALLSSLPQLAERNSQLYSIMGTPPSLYNKIVGDAFAPRNPYCLKIDTLEEPPMYKVSDTHYAKTWLLDERSEKVEKPELIDNIHEKLIKAFNVKEVE